MDLSGIKDKPRYGIFVNWVFVDCSDIGITCYWIKTYYFKWYGLTGNLPVTFLGSLIFAEQVARGCKSFVER
jgi:hypothetical protein